MKVLIACEKSQRLCIAFRKKGYEAYSCDIDDCTGGHPEWHIKGDAIDVAYNSHNGVMWDLMIGHPPCTYMSKAGARWMYQPAGVLNQDRLKEALKAKEFFMKLANAPIPFIRLENPVALKVVGLPPHTQVVQPYEYGDPYSKKTLLWDFGFGLPDLVPTNILSDYKPFLPSNTGGAKRGQKFMYKSITQEQSSVTFQGIADAIADQWGRYVSRYINNFILPDIPINYYQQ